MTCREPQHIVRDLPSDDAGAMPATEVLGLFVARMVGELVVRASRRARRGGERAMPRPFVQEPTLTFRA